MTEKEVNPTESELSHRRYMFLKEQRRLYIRLLARLKEERKENVKEYKTSSDILSLAGLASEQKHLRKIQKEIEELERRGVR